MYRSFGNGYRSSFWHVFCQAVYHGWLVTYIQVFKSDSVGLCANVWRLANFTNTNGSLRFRYDEEPFDAALLKLKRLTFTAVREPLGHFESGFSEVALRHRKYDLDPCCADPQNASGFVAAYLAGRVFNPTCCGRSARLELHVLPQVAFLTHAAASLPDGAFDRILRLETLEADWAQMGKAVPGWPPFDAGLYSVPWHPRPPGKYAHKQSNASSGNPQREQMRSVLGDNATGHRTAERLAMCRVLLPDYACLGYALPAGCEALQGAHTVDCSPLAGALQGALLKVDQGVVMHFG